MFWIAFGTTMFFMAALIVERHLNNKLLRAYNETEKYLAEELEHAVRLANKLRLENLKLTQQLALAQEAIPDPFVTRDEWKAMERQLTKDAAQREIDENHGNKG